MTNTFTRTVEGNQALFNQIIQDRRKDLSKRKPASGDPSSSSTTTSTTAGKGKGVKRSADGNPKSSGKGTDDMNDLIDGQVAEEQAQGAEARRLERAKEGTYPEESENPWAGLK